MHTYIDHTHTYMQVCTHTRMHARTHMCMCLHECIQCVRVTLQALLSSTLPPNSARTGYATEGAHHNTTYLSTSALDQRPVEHFGTNKTWR